VTISRELIREIRAMDAYDLRRLMMLIRGLLLEDPPDKDAPGPGKITFRQQTVRCGKDGCTACPHGPYWYAYWREGGKTRSRYIGKTLPVESTDPGSSQD
jgi:hypothetical protein